jgi:hypothetical protein
MIDIFYYWNVNQICFRYMTSIMVNCRITWELDKNDVKREVCDLLRFCQQSHLYISLQPICVNWCMLLMSKLQPNHPLSCKTHHCANFMPSFTPSTSSMADPTSQYGYDPKQNNLLNIVLPQRAMFWKYSVIHQRTMHWIQCHPPQLAKIIPHSNSPCIMP